MTALIPHTCEHGHRHGMHPLSVRVAREQRWTWPCLAPGCSGHLWPSIPAAEIPRDHRDDGCRDEVLALAGLVAVAVLAWRRWRR
ncbi:hypothetical protein [Actinomadura litoris]|uniref:hypothetical protein n=1 Tax=Actinomadura litoris TaxID=2678616 RepID=UPI001FA6FCCA|nr:hypothetical protein [Actinomadura litoris]